MRRERCTSSKTSFVLFALCINIDVCTFVHVFCIAGLMIPWRRRWCVLKDDTFMWFRSKQESLKSGWLYKKGGGLSTLSRRNWKMRWFVLRDTKLMYFDNDSEEKLKGTIDIRTAKYGTIVVLHTVSVLHSCCI